MSTESKGDISVTRDGYVAIAAIRRPPHNYFDQTLIEDLSEIFESLDADKSCRAIVLASEGKSFCAGANFAAREERGGQVSAEQGPGALYRAATRLFATRKPIIGAIQGAAVGGGLGLALVPDFRVATPEARFTANFVKIGIHAGFGLTLTLPRLIGVQAASLLLMTGRRIDGEEALRIGLADVLTTPDKLAAEALSLAREIAENAPLGILATRATLRRDIVAAFAAQTEHELAEQQRLFATADYREGVRAVAERRVGNFIGA